MRPTTFTEAHTSAPAANARFLHSNPAIQIKNNFWKAYPHCRGVPMAFLRASFVMLEELLYPNLPAADAVLNYESGATEVRVTKVSPDYPPTHVVAVLPFDHNDDTIPVLYPVHHIVFSAYCAYFPDLPKHFPGQGRDSKEISLPVYRVVLDSPAAFPVMLHYFYTRDIDWLVRTLGSQPLREQKDFIRGFRNNLIKLGVVDEPLYEAVDKAWEACLRLRQLAMPDVQELAPFTEAQDQGWLQLEQGYRL
ncbi:hypothetical protein LshimejAT787_1102550 [Lyophyllum shimeji]|uniref:Uncharacterized protein n=1 Tax=Lyophyllum shimeji TaxID=47721 RepID=A0A9P3PSZ5_LYOSH|nr:hypothetical protein LshimejAT787_1102550 [Lyophyllum shimeji]